jgi:hypothetical protein
VESFFQYVPFNNMAHPAAPKIKDLGFADPMFVGLSETDYNELYFQVQMITEYMAAVDPKHTFVERVEWFMDFTEYCYTHALCMQRLPGVRSAIMKRFEDLFEGIASGHEIPLSLRDQLNRRFGMMVEYMRNITEHSLCLF